MKKLFFFSFGILLGMGAMAQPDATYTYSGEGGVSYKVFHIGSGVNIPYGSYVQYTMEQLYKDSLLIDSKNRKMVMAIDSAAIPKPFFLPLRNVNVGDSVVYAISIDSNKQMYSSLPWAKEGQYFNTRMKIEKMFSSAIQAQAAILINQREDSIADAKRSEAQLIADSKTIETYLAANKIQYIKTPAGVYISFAKKGKGPLPTSQSVVSVNYTGKSFEGKAFDSNTDPAFNHVTPLDVDLKRREGLILGWLESIPYFAVGTKATVYIPSSLGYGAQGSEPRIAPNENLIFDIEAVKITNPATTKTATKTPAKAPAKAPVKAAAKPKAPAKH
jgi:FKBP-type peptidyl-prolyl cis-trans isomerase